MNIGTWTSDVDGRKFEAHILPLNNDCVPVLADTDVPCG